MNRTSLPLPGAVNIIWDILFFSRLAAACKAEHGLVA